MGCIAGIRIILVVKSCSDIHASLARRGPRSQGSQPSFARPLPQFKLLLCRMAPANDGQCGHKLSKCEFQRLSRVWNVSQLAEAESKVTNAVNF